MSRPRGVFMQIAAFTRSCAVFAVLGLATVAVSGCAGEIIDTGDRQQGVGINDRDNGDNGGHVGPSSLNRGFGLTFGISDDKNIGPELVHPSCHAYPMPVDQPWRGSCNPYVGDTSCESARPILCVRMDGSPAPANVSFDFYHGWVPGEFASTSPVVGNQLTSRRAADQICESELGQGFRMAAFHDADGNGGWTYTGKRGQRMDGQSRQWVYIDDQPGNCWNATR